MESENFYAEANDMQSGWGEYLRAIDTLRGKVEANEGLTLREACWVIWAELQRPSSVWLKFQVDIVQLEYSSTMNMNCLGQSGGVCSRLGRSQTADPQLKTLRH